MKVLITDDQLDSLLSIKISSDGGKTYTDYNVSSLKNNGLALDCNPNDLKVIYDTNILNYIKVLADGEKLNTSSGGVNTYAHKVELEINNMSLHYYGDGRNICTFSLIDIANGEFTKGEYENGEYESASGDLEEILNFYPILMRPNFGAPYTKESKIAYHIYLKDADTENLVRGVGLVWSDSLDKQLGIIFNSGTQSKFFTNTLVLEWGLEVSSGSSSQTTVTELSVTENGTYNAGSNAAYNPVIVNVPSGGEDKLLCYYAGHQEPKGRFVYTDKPATQISCSTSGTPQTYLPVDEGKHLFIMPLSSGGYELKSINLIYEDGSRSADLKDKFVEV